MQNRTFGHEYGEPFEQAVLWLLLNDSEYADTMHNVLTEDMFERRAYQIIFDHLSTAMKASGGRVTFQTVLTELKTARAAMTKNSPVRLEYADAMVQLVGLKSTECTAADFTYVKEKTETFITRANVREALLESAKDYEQNDFLSIARRIEQAVNGRAALSSEQDMGITFDSLGDRLKRYAANAVSVKHAPLDIPRFDAAIRGGLEPGNLGLIMAPANRGKSLLLVQAAAASLRRGQNVVIVSLELSDIDYAQRLDANFSGVPVNEIHTNARRHLRELVAATKKHLHGRVFIKKFPEDVTTVDDLRYWLKSLQSRKGFTPDTIVIDYLDLLKHSRERGQRPDLGITSRELRRLGSEFNAPVWSATQTNRASYDGTRVELKHVAEDIQKVHVADVIVGWAQQDSERARQVGRLVLLKSRQSGNVGLQTDCKMLTDTMTVEQSATQRSSNRLGQP